MLWIVRMLEKDWMVLISIVLSSKWCRWVEEAMNVEDDAGSVCSPVLSALLSRNQVILKGWSPWVLVHMVWTLIPSWMSSPKLNGVILGGTGNVKCKMFKGNERILCYVRAVISDLYSYFVCLVLDISDERWVWMNPIDFSRLLFHNKHQPLSVAGALTLILTSAIISSSRWYSGALTCYCKTLTQIEEV